MIRIFDRIEVDESSFEEGLEGFGWVTNSVDEVM